MGREYQACYWLVMTLVTASHAASQSIVRGIENRCARGVERVRMYIICIVSQIGGDARLCRVACWLVWYSERVLQ